MVSGWRSDRVCFILLLSLFLELLIFLVLFLGVIPWYTRHSCLSFLIHFISSRQASSETMDEKIDLHDPSDSTPPEPAGQVMPSTYIKPQARALHDPNISFEEYHYYALRTREEEKTLVAPMLNWREFLMRRKNAQNNAEDSNGQLDPMKRHTEANFANKNTRLEITDEEWTNASRAFRTASWGACMDQILALTRFRC